MCWIILIHAIDVLSSTTYVTGKLSRLAVPHSPADIARLFSVVRQRTRCPGWAAAIPIEAGKGKPLGPCPRGVTTRQASPAAPPEHEREGVGAPASGPTPGSP